jgi:molecular chaperone DnaK
MPAPRGIPQIEVTFDIDANGILNVSAKDKGTGKEQKVTITASSGLNENEIQKMVSDAESHATEDKQKREQIEARNQLDSLIYSTEKMLKEHKDKLPGHEATELEATLQAAKKTLENAAASLDELRGQTETLTRAGHKLAETVYKQSAPGPAATGVPPTGGDGHAAKTTNGSGKAGEPRSNVIDAEFDEVSK